MRPTDNSGVAARFGIPVCSYMSISCPCSYQNDYWNDYYGGANTNTNTNTNKVQDGMSPQSDYSRHQQSNDGLNIYIREDVKIISKKKSERVKKMR